MRVRISANILCGSGGEVNVWWLWNSQEAVQKNERCGV